MSMVFAPRITVSGFDNYATPKWQMVPEGGERVLTISGYGTRVLRYDSTTVEAVQTVAGKTTTLKLTGKKPGRTSLEWVPSAAFIGAAETGFTLEVSVKKLAEVHTAFHYVDDGRKQVTNRRISALDGMIAVANSLLTTQANVKIIRKSAAALPIAQDLGRVVRFVGADLTGAPHNVPAAEDEWDDLLAKVDPTADFNVFFVKAYEQDETPGINDTRAGTIASDKMCILEDNLSAPPSEVLAHETLHLLGLDDHSTNDWHLIASGATRKGRWINKVQANIINKSGT